MINMQFKLHINTLLLLPMIVVAMLAGELSFAADETFVLPDLFITAKDTQKLDTASKEKVDYRQQWSYEGVLPSVRTALTPVVPFPKAVLESDLPKPAFREIYVGAGVPTMFHFKGIYGGEWDERPFLLSAVLNSEHRYTTGALQQFDLRGLCAFPNSGEGDIRLGSKVLEASQLSTLQAGWNGVNPNSIKAVSQLYMINAYAGNTGTSFWQNQVGLPQVSFEALGQRYGFDLAVSTLFTPGYLYGDIRTHNQSRYSFFGMEHNLDYGANIWTNASNGRIGLLATDVTPIPLTANQQGSAYVELQSRPVDVTTLYETDYAAWNNAGIPNDDWFGIGVSLNNLLNTSEMIGFSWRHYGTLKAFDDPLSTGYFSLRAFHDVSVLDCSVAWNSFSILSENIKLMANLPFYSFDIPNQDTHWLSAKWQKQLWAGQLNSELAWNAREAGRTNPVNYKDSWLDLNLSYEKELTTDMWWSVAVNHLLGGGAEIMSGRRLSDPIISGQVRWIF